MLLDAAGPSGQWWWETVLDVGGVLTASYVVLVLARALSPAAEPIKLHHQSSRRQLQSGIPLPQSLLNLLVNLLTILKPLHSHRVTS